MFEWSHIAGKGSGVAKRHEIAKELEFTGGISAGKGIQKESSKAGAEDFDGEQEFRVGGDPAVMVGRKPAAGDHAMQVGMEVEILPPGVEDGEKAGFHTEALGVSGNGEESLGGDAEEQVVDEFLVVEGNRGERGGEREDHVKVGSGQEFGGVLF